MMVMERNYLVIHFISISCLISCVLAYTCTETAYCTCKKGNPTQECGYKNNFTLEIDYQSAKNSIKITCNVYSIEANASGEYNPRLLDGVEYFDYVKLLNGINVGNVNSVLIEHCPLPKESFEELFTIANVVDLKSFMFVSHSNITLHSRSIGNLPFLEQLRLSQNGIESLPEDIFRGLPELKILYLIQNRLKDLPTSIFSNNSRLEVIDLGMNSFSNLNEELLAGIRELKSLNLYNNRLKNSLSRSFFAKIPTLKSLDISKNGITSLPNDVFGDLANLEIVNLSFNNFTTLPRDLFKNSPNVISFRLINNYNPITEIPAEIFSNLQSVKNITMNYNNLSALPENVFWVSPNLTMISLKKNSLVWLPSGFLNGAETLEVLDLSENKLKSLNDTIFAKLEQLSILKLNRNFITRISSLVFGSLINLEEIDLSDNLLTTIEFDAFENLHKLKRIKMENNRLTLTTAIPERSPFSNCLMLEELYLANNNITLIFDDWRLVFTKLKLLDLRKNKIEKLTAQELTFVTDSPSTLIDLSYNKLRLIDLLLLETFALLQCDFPPCRMEDIKDHKLYLKLGHNPVYCDCGVYNLARYVQNEMNMAAYKFVKIDSENLVCDGPRNINSVPVAQVNLHDITCSWDVSPGYDKSVCPPGFLCEYRPIDSAVIGQYTNKGATDVPIKIPFTEAANHTELNLAGNELKSFVLRPEYSRAYANVTKLKLSRNQLERVSVDHLSDRLQVLELDNNRLSRLDEATLSFLNNSDKLEGITLSGNPWICDCESVPLLSFLQRRYKKVSDLPNVTCADTNTPLMELTTDSLCGISNIIIVIGAVVALAGLALGCIVALYYRYQHEIKVWMYAHRVFLRFVTETEIDKDKNYDAFISFSHEDEAFVVECLVPELERQPNPFKLCIHYRDWLGGEWIPAQIVKSVEESRRTIVVLSPSFLRSVWGKMEFRTAHVKAIKERRARVIVIMYEDVVDMDKLDPELRAYLSMNTYVKWGDPWFWKKLRYAMPHPPIPEKRKTLTQQKLNKKANWVMEMTKKEFDRIDQSSLVSETDFEKQKINHLPKFESEIFDRSRESNKYGKLSSPNCENVAIA